MQKAFFLFLLMPALLFSKEESEAASYRAIKAHMQLHDLPGAVTSAKRAVELFPESNRLQVALVEALAENGQEMAALQQWKKLPLKEIPPKQREALLEKLSWGVINKGSSSSQIAIRRSTLLCAALTRDSLALPIILSHLRDSNSYLRAFCVKLVPFLGDEILCSELLQMLHTEKVWYVRLELLDAIGKLRLKEAQPQLRALITAPQTLFEERAYAVIALVSLYEKVDEQELALLLSSDRAGLRQLAAELIVHFDLKEQKNALFPLCNDASTEVRISAINAIALLEGGEPALLTSYLVPLLSDPNPRVAITAAFALVISGQKETQKEAELSLSKWLAHPNSEWARFAAAAIAHCGKKGVSLALSEIEKAQDPYVQMNLAMGLIGQRKGLKMAGFALWRGYKSDALFVWDRSRNPLIPVLQRSVVSADSSARSDPLVVDELIRLELLSLLHCIGFPQAAEGMKELLKSRSLEVTGRAAVSLLEEGDVGARELVEKLLKDKDERVRLQAALVLGSREDEAADVLMDAFDRVDRMEKIQILEALANNKRSIPFLLEVFEKPNQGLRLVAASALIQCLYK